MNENLKIAFFNQPFQIVLLLIGQTCVNIEISKLAHVCQKFEFPLECIAISEIGLGPKDSQCSVRCCLEIRLLWEGTGRE